jgi:hypothetical protein
MKKLLKDSLIMKIFDYNLRIKKLSRLKQLCVAKFTKHQAIKAKQEAKIIQRLNMTDEEKAELRVLNAQKRVENARTKQINELKLCEDAESSQRILES